MSTPLAPNHSNPYGMVPVGRSFTSSVVTLDSSVWGPGLLPPLLYSITTSEQVVLRTSGLTHESGTWTWQRSWTKSKWNTDFPSVCRGRYKIRLRDSNNWNVFVFSSRDRRTYRDRKTGSDKISISEPKLVIQNISFTFKVHYIPELQKPYVNKEFRTLNDLK